MPNSSYATCIHPFIHVFINSSIPTLSSVAPRDDIEQGMGIHFSPSPPPSLSLCVRVCVSASLTSFPVPNKSGSKQQTSAYKAFTEALAQAHIKAGVFISAYPGGQKEKRESALNRTPTELITHSSLCKTSHGPEPCRADGRSWHLMSTTTSTLLT